MIKTFIPMLVTGAAALVFGGAAIAADQSQDPQANPAQQNLPANPGDGGAGVQRDVMKEKDTYFAEMSRCDALKGMAEKQQCVDTVRKQYGQM